MADSVLHCLQTGQLDLAEDVAKSSGVAFPDFTTQLVVVRDFNVSLVSGCYVHDLTRKGGALRTSLLDKKDRLRTVEWLRDKIPQDDDLESLLVFTMVCGWVDCVAATMEKMSHPPSFEERHSLLQSAVLGKTRVSHTTLVEYGARVTPIKPCPVELSEALVRNYFENILSASAYVAFWLVKFPLKVVERSYTPPTDQIRDYVRALRLDNVKSIDRLLLVITSLTDFIPPLGGLSAAEYRAVFFKEINSYTTASGDDRDCVMYAIERFSPLVNSA